MDCHEFSQFIGVAKEVESIEQPGRAPKGDMLEAICLKSPHYSLWLMTGQVNETAGQVSPEIEKARRAFKSTETDTE